MKDKPEKQDSKAAAPELGPGFAEVLLEAANFMVVGLDLRGNVTIFNAEAERISGYSREEILGRNMFETMSKGRGDGSVWNAFRLMPSDSAGPGSFDCESELVTKLGEERNVAWRFSAIANHAGETRIVAFGSDVTERRHYERKSRDLSRKVIVMQEEERAALSRELHDELGQQLTAMRMELEWLRKRNQSGADAEYIQMIGGMVESASLELRRICRGLRPQILDDLGLAAAMEALADEFAQILGIDVEFSADQFENAEIPPETAICVYRVQQEALNNIAKHAKAGSARVSFTRHGGGFMLEVADDGAGFSPADGAGERKSYGIIGMNERAGMCGGTLDIASAPGAGAKVVMKIPGVGEPSAAG